MTGGDHKPGDLLVNLTFWLPSERMPDLLAFLRDLDDNGIRWNAKMDSHPPDPALDGAPQGPST